MLKLFIKAKNFLVAAVDRTKEIFFGTRAVLACNRGEGFVDTAGASARA